MLYPQHCWLNVPFVFPFFPLSFPFLLPPFLLDDIKRCTDATHVRVTRNTIVDNTKMSVLTSGGDDDSDAAEGGATTSTPGPSPPLATALACVVGGLRLWAGTTTSVIGTGVNWLWVAYDLLVLSVIVEAARFRVPEVPVEVEERAA